MLQSAISVTQWLSTRQYIFLKIYSLAIEAIFYYCKEEDINLKHLPLITEPRSMTTYGF